MRRVRRNTMRTPRPCGARSLTSQRGFAGFSRQLRVNVSALLKVDGRFTRSRGRLAPSLRNRPAQRRQAQRCRAAPPAQASNLRQGETITWTQTSDEAQVRLRALGIRKAPELLAGGGGGCTCRDCPFPSWLPSAPCLAPSCIMLYAIWCVGGQTALDGAPVSSPATDTCATRAPAPGNQALCAGSGPQVSIPVPEGVRGRDITCEVRARTRPPALPRTAAAATPSPYQPHCYQWLARIQKWQPAIAEQMLCWLAHISRSPGASVSCRVHCALSPREGASQAGAPRGPRGPAAGGQPHGRGRRQAGR